jgi:hypothetical protein
VETTKSNNIVSFLKRVYFKNDKRVAAYLICVAIATGFWFLNALSKTYTVDLNVPINYINLPANKTLANQPPEKFELKVRAHGFTIIRYKISFWILPMAFNVNNMTGDRMETKSKNYFAFPSWQFLSPLSNQFSNEMEVVKMSPDTLFFKFDKLSEKWVKIKPMVKIDLDKQYRISGNLQTIPDSINISGPQSILDTIRYISTVMNLYEKVDEAINEQIALNKIRETFFERQTVKLIVPVEEYTETQLPVPVDLPDSPADKKIKLFPAKVKVIFKVSLSRFSEIKPEDFKLIVTYNEIVQGKQKLKVFIESTPPFLYDLKIVPEELEYLIEN